MQYSYLKLIHLLAVVLFIGNIINGLFGMHHALKTNELKIINFMMQGIRKADRYLAMPGIIVITACGILAAISGHLPILQTGWIFWSIVMFSISGLVFVLKVMPLQKKIYHLTLNKESSTVIDWKYFKKVNFAWNIWGLIVLFSVLAAFVMMTLKIPY